MKYSEAHQGRIFIIRMEDGDILPDKIEQFAADNAIQRAMLIAVGGVDEGSKLVVGPEAGRAQLIHPMEYILNNVHEISGTGTIFPDKEGKPKLHLHIACGRNDSTKTGCVRLGIKVWHVMEIILIELINTSAQRLVDQETGFELLVP